MRKKLLGATLLIASAAYFSALFRHTDAFARLSEPLSYLCFLGAVTAGVVGFFLLALQTPQAHEKECTAKRAQLRILRENRICAPTLVYALIGLNVAAFALVNLWQGEATLEKFAVSKENAALYRMCAAMFLHVDATHLLFNMAALWICGGRLESLIGHARFAATYFLSGICASVALAVFSEQPCVGASGAIFGVLGCLLPLAFANRAVIAYTFWKELLPTALGNLILTFLLPNLSVSAHVVGFAVGMLMWVLLCRRVRLVRTRE